MKAATAAILLVFGLTPLLSAQTSHLNEVRAKASARFGPQLVSVRQEVDRVDAVRRQYADACQGKVTAVRPVYPQGIPLDHPPTVSGGLVSGTPPATTGASLTPLQFEIRNETTAQCLVLRSDIVAGVASVERRLASISEDARRAGIYPGVMRDLRTATGLPPLD
jgi:hypothetical protein